MKYMHAPGGAGADWASKNACEIFADESVKAEDPDDDGAEEIKVDEEANEGIEDPGLETETGNPKKRCRAFNTFPGSSESEKTTNALREHSS